MLQAVESFQQVFIVFDAFDESPEENYSRERLLEALNVCKDSISILIFSRPSDLDMKDCVKIHIEAREEDIASYLNNRLSRYKTLQAHFQKEPELRQTIIDSIIPKAEKMCVVFLFPTDMAPLTELYRFLLAKLYADTIVSKGSRRHIKKALKSLPEGLFNAYDDAMDRFGAQGQYDIEIALRLMHWVFYAHRPLTILEIEHALAVEIEDPEFDPDGILEIDKLISSCAGMVVINEESGVVAFLHFTVQEYFHHNGQKHFRNLSSDITQTCLTYFLFKNIAIAAEPDRDLTAMEEYPLISYSAKHWGDHARTCSDKFTEDMAMKYLRGSRPTFHIKIGEETAFIDERQGPTSGPFVSPLCVAASFGLNIPTSRLLDSTEMNFCDEMSKERALRMTAINNFPNAAKILLQGGVNINAGDTRRWCPLHHAAWLGHELIVDILIEYSADLNIKDSYNETPLARAAEPGHHSIVEVLLRHGASINSTNIMGQTAAHHAACMGHGSVILVLLDYKTSLETKDY